VSVTPYYDEDMRKLADLIGVDKGAVRFRLAARRRQLANPLDFVKELHAFSDDEIRLVMRDNAPGAARSERNRCVIAATTRTTTEPGGDRDACRRTRARPVGERQPTLGDMKQPD